MTNKGSSAGVINRMKNKDKFFKIKEDKLIERMNKSMRDKAIEELRKLNQLKGISAFFTSLLHPDNPSQEWVYQLEETVDVFNENHNSEFEDKLSVDDSFQLVTVMDKFIDSFEETKRKCFDHESEHNTVPKTLLRGMKVNDDGNVVMKINKGVSNHIRQAIEDMFNDEIESLYGVRFI